MLPIFKMSLGLLTYPEELSVLTLGFFERQNTVLCGSERCQGLRGLYLRKPPLPPWDPGQESSPPSK